MNRKEEIKKEVAWLAKQIKSQRTFLWTLVKYEEFEKAELVKNNIKVLQKKLIKVLINPKNKQM